jgi:hypothetical protein
MGISWDSFSTSVAMLFDMMIDHFRSLLHQPMAAIFYDQEVRPDLGGHGVAV